MWENTVAPTGIETIGAILQEFSKKLNCLNLVHLSTQPQTTAMLGTSCTINGYLYDFQVLGKALNHEEEIYSIIHK